MTSDALSARVGSPGRGRHAATRLPRLILAVVLAGSLAGVSACSNGVPEPPPTASTSPVPAPQGRPSGLIWDSGVFEHQADGSADFEMMRGRKLDVIGVAPTRDTWDSILGTWWLDGETIPADFAGTLNVAVPLFPADGNLADAASGRYDERWRELGRRIAKDYPDAYVRPGWEFNIHNWHWSANPDNIEQWKEAFRHASRSLREGGSRLRIVWNPNEGRGDTLPNAADAWPGDKYVDVVGLDAYDWHPPYDEKGWAEHKTKDQGWDYWARFTREHGKRFALPEWGVYSGSDDSGGDNPAYVDYVFGWLYDNRDLVAFESYFEEEADYCRCALSQNPKARAAYQNWMPRLDSGAGSD